MNETALFAAHVALGGTTRGGCHSDRCLVLEFLVDITTGLVHDVASNAGSWLSQDVLRDIFRGDSLLQPPQRTVDLLHSRYHSCRRKPLIAAFLQIYRMFYAQRMGQSVLSTEGIPTSTLHLLSSARGDDYTTGRTTLGRPPAAVDLSPPLLEKTP